MHVSHCDDQPGVRRMADRVRRSENDHGAARPADALLADVAHLMHRVDSDRGNGVFQLIWISGERGHERSTRTHNSCTPNWRRNLPSSAGAPRPKGPWPRGRHDDQLSSLQPAKKNADHTMELPREPVMALSCFDFAGQIIRLMNHNTRSPSGNVRRKQCSCDNSCGQ
jgi:hypothetical protein